jgi:hypothetical protein
MIYLPTRWVRKRHPNTTDHIYSLASERDVPVSFSNKIIVSQHKNTIMFFKNMRIIK